MRRDPFEVLGVRSDATPDELQAARRRLAMTLHPDVGGDAAAMQELNVAYDEAERIVTAPPAPRAGAADVQAGRASRPNPAPAPRPAPDAPHRARWMRGVQTDAPSFTIDVLPVEAFEALLVVCTWMGEVLVDDPPYLLECLLQDPAPCWCRLDLVPDAGATTVSLMVAGVDGAPTPDPEDVRDEWVANLNRLGDIPG